MEFEISNPSQVSYVCILIACLHFNIEIPFILRSRKWPVSLKMSKQYFACISLHEPHRLFHPPWMQMVTGHNIHCLCLNTYSPCRFAKYLWTCFFESTLSIFVEEFFKLLTGSNQRYYIPFALNNGHEELLVISADGREIWDLHYVCSKPVTPVLYTRFYSASIFYPYELLS